MLKKVKSDRKTYNDQLDKRGKPYEYSKILMDFLAFPQYFSRLLFRKDEGFETLKKFVLEPEVPG